ncbi:hypothetical protein IAR55_004941 [Kwoniella newhampshirensis]|uniref:Telomere replication protein EST3 n=1 Tax=Kwoniella newhampshirensis TaxID=1651941 RepID=A0AAW0YMA9_9TREE
MAESLGSWLAKAVVQHDRQYGANLELDVAGGYCQLKSFSSYRTEDDPHNEIIGFITDQTHHAKVIFDVDATDEFEKAIPGLGQETLTSHLRAIFKIQSFRFVLEDTSRQAGPSVPGSATKSAKRQHIRSTVGSPYLDLPRVALYVNKWEVLSGDRNDPLFHIGTAEVGRGSRDGDVQKVLRKWWLGESYSDPSQNQSSQMETPSRPQSFPSSGPRQLYQTPAPPPTSQPVFPRSSPSSIQPPQARGTLSSFLQPYLAPAGGKKPKPIPEWIFEKPDEAKRQLEDITIFGADIAIDIVHTGSRQAGQTSNGPAEGSTTRGGKERETDAEFHPRVESSHLDLSPKSPSPPPAAQSLPMSKEFEAVLDYCQQEDEKDKQRKADQDQSDDDDIPVRPIVPQRKKRGYFDPLSIPTPDSSQHAQGVNNEDGEELSDYDREEMRKAEGSRHSIANAAGEKALFEEDDEDEKEDDGRQEANEETGIAEASVEDDDAEEDKNIDIHVVVRRQAVEGRDGVQMPASTHANKLQTEDIKMEDGQSMDNEDEADAREAEKLVAESGPAVNGHQDAKHRARIEVTDDPHHVHSPITNSRATDVDLRTRSELLVDDSDQSLLKSQSQSEQSLSRSHGLLGQRIYLQHTDAQASTTFGHTRVTEARVGFPDGLDTTQTQDRGHEADISASYEDESIPTHVSASRPDTVTTQVNPGNPFQSPRHAQTSGVKREFESAPRSIENKRLRMDHETPRSQVGSSASSSKNGSVKSFLASMRIIKLEDDGDDGQRRGGADSPLNGRGGGVGGMLGRLTGWGRPSGETGGEAQRAADLVRDHLTRSHVSRGADSEGSENDEEGEAESMDIDEEEDEEEEERMINGESKTHRRFDSLDDTAEQDPDFDSVSDSEDEDEHASEHEVVVPAWILAAPGTNLRVKDFGAADLSRATRSTSTRQSNAANATSRQRRDAEAGKTSSKGGRPTKQQQSSRPNAVEPLDRKHSVANHEPDPRPVRQIVKSDFQPEAKIKYPKLRSFKPSLPIEGGFSEAQVLELIVDIKERRRVKKEKTE